MCGLAGFIYKTNKNLNFNKILKDMGNSISHRGPDDNGEFYNNDFGVGLSHRRLSILDLSINGHQPMIDTKQQYSLVYNGELYNHNELREELVKEGREISWKGNGDTETLFNALICWGVKKTLNKCHGMFAFVFCDYNKKKIYLVRDRLGEKPLYYGFKSFDGDKVFLFGSELKAIESFKNFNKELDKESIALFFKYGNIPNPFSIYKDIFKLKPGCIAKISIDDLSVEYDDYWSINSTVLNSRKNSFKGSINEAADILENKLKKVLSNQMLSDVDLGAFLSGGIDSSLIVSLMQSISTSSIKTFSIGTNQEKLNEALYAKNIANHLGTDHTELYIDKKDVTKLVPNIQDIYDEPFADSSQIPTYLVSKLARKNVKVALSGDGGDEIFCGYNRYKFFDKYWKLISSTPINIRKILFKIYEITPSVFFEFILNNILRKNIYNTQSTLNKVFSIIKSNSIDEAYNYIISLNFDIDEKITNNKNDNLKIYNEFSDFKSIEIMMVEDTKNYLTNDILTKVDRAAMSVSLETRIPFLDHKIIEYAWSLPLDYKLKNENGNYETKYILKKILSKYLPYNLINKKKMGFAIPISSWLKEDLKEWTEDLLNENNIKDIGFLDYKYIKNLWKNFLDGRTELDTQIWSILMFQSWLRK